MASTTLTTFFLKTARDVVSVELLGSWDNFGRPYAMERDRKLGRGNWRGCHSFAGIICDGDAVNPPESVRDGGLLQGGTYWYYFRLNDDTEVHDSSRPATTTCPFLPGQQVNVLDVPMQLTREGDSLAEDLPLSFTMIPGDRFRTLQPLEASSSVPAPRTSRDVEYPTRPHSPAADCRPMTAVKGTEHVSNPFAGMFPGSRTAPRRARTAYAPGPRLCVQDSLRPYTTNGIPDHWDPREFHQYLEELMDHEEQPAYSDSPRQRSDARRLSCALERLSLGDILGSTAPSGEYTTYWGDRDEYTTPTTPTGTFHPNALAEDTPEPAGATGDMYLEEEVAAGAGTGPWTRSLQHTFSVSSNRTSAFFSSITGGSDLNDPESCRPHHRNSQPLTPTRGDFGEMLMTTTWATPEQERQAPGEEGSAPFSSEAMNVYSLPEADTASALTLHNLETATVKSVGAASPTLEVGTSRGLVEAWNDGNDHRGTGLQELVDEMGYLGSLIR